MNKLNLLSILALIFIAMLPSGVAVSPTPYPDSNPYNATDGWRFDEIGTPSYFANFINISNNMTNSLYSTNTVIGLINNAMNGTKKGACASSYYDIDSLSKSFFMTMWIKPNEDIYNGGNQHPVYQDRHPDYIHNPGDSNLQFQSNGKLGWQDPTGSTVNVETNKNLWYNNTWYYIVLNYNQTSSNFSIWVNGQMDVSVSESGGRDNGNQFCIGVYDASTGNITFDEFIIGVGNSLTQEDILYLYNGTRATSSLNINIISPSNNTINNTLNWNFRFNYTFNETATACRLYTNETSWSAKETVSNPAVNATITIPHNFTTDGAYVWSISCNSSNNTQFFAGENRTLTVDTTVPMIIPISSLLNNHTIVWNGTLNTQISYSDDRQLYSIFTILNNGSIITNLTHIDQASYTDNISYNIGSNILNSLTTTVCDSHTNDEIEPIDYSPLKGGIKYKIEKTWFWFDEEYISVYPEDYSNYNPATTTKKKDRYTFKFNSKINILPQQQKSFIVESSQYIDIIDNSEYCGHLVIPNINKGYWFDFNNNQTNDCNVERIDDKSIKVTITGLSGKELYFSSIGELNCVNATYYFGNLNPNIAYDPIVVQNGNYNISLKVNKDSATMPIINATLYYGGIPYFVGSTPNFTQTITAPNLSVSYPFYWLVGISGAGYFNLTNIAATQNVSLFSIDDCSSNTKQTLNITYFDEANYTPIVVDSLGSISYSYNGVSKTYNINKPSQNNLTFCIFPNFISADGTLTLSYSSAFYPSRNYNDNFIFSNITQNRALYGLYYTDGIYANFNIINNAGNPISGARGVMEKSVNGSYITTEIESSDDVGVMTFWADPDLYYRYTFSKDGCTTQSSVLRRTTSESYTVTLVCSGSTPTSNQSYSLGINYSFTPTSPLLMNGTGYNFGFGLSSSYWGITSCSADLLDSTSSILTSASGSFSSGVCSVSIPTYTVGQSSTTLTLRGNYALNNSATLYAYKTYSVEYFYTGEFSLKTFLNDLSNFGMNGFNAATRMILAFLITFILIAFISYKFGVSEAEILIGMLIMFVWLFSYIGWIYLDYANIPLIMGSDILKRYLLAIMITLAGGSFILKKVTE